MPPCSGRSTHEKFLADHAQAWKLLLYVSPGGGALLLILTFFFLFIPPIILAPLPTLWTMSHGDYDPPHGIKFAAERGTQTNEMVYRGG